VKQNHWYHFKRLGLYYPTTGCLTRTMFSRRFLYLCEKEWTKSIAQRVYDRELAKPLEGGVLFAGR